MYDYIKDCISVTLVLAFLGAAMELRNNSFVVNFGTGLADNTHDCRSRSPVWACRAWANITLEQMEQVEVAPTWLIPLAMGEAACGARGHLKGTQAELGGETEVGVRPPANRRIGDHRPEGARKLPPSRQQPAAIVRSKVIVHSGRTECINNSPNPAGQSGLGRGLSRDRGGEGAGRGWHCRATA